MLTLIAFVVLVVAHVFLRERVRKLEEALGNAPKRVFPAFPDSAGETPIPAPVLSPVAFERKAGETPAFIQWLKEDWLVKLGGLIILLGFAWLASYAFLHGWIGPASRIALGLLGGVVLLSLGWLRMQKYAREGSIFVVLGSSVILLTTFAARWLYGFFTPTSALLLMFASTVFVALASLKYRVRSLAVASIILAGIVPFLTRATEVNELELFAYLLAIILGAIWIVAQTGWRIVTMTALLVVTVHSFPYIFGGAQADAALFFAYVFAAIFFIATATSIMRRVVSGGWGDDLVIAAWNGLLLLFWILYQAPEVWQSLILSFWTVVFLAGAFVVFRATGRRESLIAYGAVGVVFLGAATAVELEGAVLTIAFALEAALLVIVSHLILRSLAISEKISLLFAIPAFLSLPSITAGSWNNGVIHEDFFVLLTMTIVLLFAGSYLYRERLREDASANRDVGKALFVIGTVYAYILLWLTLGALLEARVAVPIALFIYTVIGLWCYLYGRIHENSAFRLYGGALVGFVVARMLFVEVWNMELTARIFTFFAIGALLMSTAFIGKRKNEEIHG